MRSQQKRKKKKIKPRKKGISRLKILPCFPSKNFWGQIQAVSLHDVHAIVLVWSFFFIPDIWIIQKKKP